MPNIEIDKYPRNLIIIRGTSSSGKSTFAALLLSLYPQAVICCADDYFEKNGEYKFDATQLWAAHSNCQSKFKFAIDNNSELVIVANTNTSEKEWKYYYQYAIEHDYKVTFVVLEKRHENKNEHNVPDETIKNQEKRIRSSLKLS